MSAYTIQGAKKPATKSTTICLSSPLPRQESAHECIGCSIDEPGDHQGPTAKRAQRLLDYLLRIESPWSILPGRHRIPGRTDRPGTTGDHVDPTVLQLMPQAFRQHSGEGLTRRVGRDSRRPLVARERGHEND